MPTPHLECGHCHLKRCEPFKDTVNCCEKKTEEKKRRKCACNVPHRPEFGMMSPVSLNVLLCCEPMLRCARVSACVHFSLPIKVRTQLEAACGQQGERNSGLDPVRSDPDSAEKTRIAMTQRRPDRTESLMQPVWISRHRTLAGRLLFPSTLHRRDVHGQLTHRE